MREKAVICFAVLLIPTALACSSHGITNPQQTNPSTTTTTTVAAPPSAVIGQEIHNEGFSYTVTNVTTADTFASHSPGGVWKVVAFTVKNITMGPQEWRGETQVLQDGQGRSFKPDWAIFDPISFNNSSEINPGNQLSVRMAFDVPADMQPATMEFSDSYGSLTVDLTR
ncbi:MAG: DUF4352 domain-containing protein [Mycobacterium sp.]